MKLGSSVFFAGAMLCVAACGDAGRGFDFMDPTTWFGPAARGIATTLAVIIFATAGVMVGGVLGSPPGVLLSEKLQGHTLSYGGWGLGHLTALGAGALGLTVVLDLSDREQSDLLPVGLGLGALGVGLWSIAGYSIVAR